MANEVIGASVEVEYKSIGEMRKAIKEATGDVIRMQQQFGATSQQALDAAKKVAELKDRAKDAAETVDLFDPGNKFKQLGNTIQVAANGFTALQGAMGLLGVESKDLQEQLVKVQSAMALSQGLSGLADSGKEFSRLAAMVKGPVVAAFTTLRGALMATGIGLITVAVALLIENFDTVKKTIYSMFPSLEGLFDNMDRIKQIAMGVGEVLLRYVTGPVKALIKVVQGDFKGAMEEVKTMFAVTKNFRVGEQKEIEKQAADREKARQEELFKEKEKNDKIAAERKRAADAEAERRKAEIEKERQDYERRNKERLEQERGLQQKISEILDGYRKNEEDKAATTQLKKLQLQKQRAIEELALLGANSAQLSEANKYWNNQISEQQEADRQTSLTNIQQAGDRNIAILQQQSAKNIEVAKQEYQAKEEIRQSEMRLYSDVGNALAMLGDVIGKETAAGKALAAAQATINTFLGVSQVLRQPSVLPEPAATISKIVNVATILASGLSAVRNIVKTKVPGGGGGGSMPSSLSSAAPIQPQLNTTAQAQLINANAINQQGNMAVKAYVLNSDIQNTNQINAYLQRNASI